MSVCVCGFAVEVGWMDRANTKGKVSKCKNEPEKGMNVHFTQFSV